MSLSAENRVGPAFVVTDNFQPASVALTREEPKSKKAQKPGETKEREKPIDNERSGETAFDEAVRTKKVLRGGLKESKWVVPGLDPVKKRRARGLPGTYEEEQKQSLLFLSKDRKPVEALETSQAATPQVLTPRALTPPPAAAKSVFEPQTSRSEGKS